MSSEEIVTDALQGHLAAARWPAPRLLKVFIASTRSDFIEERRHLLEVVGPDLQSQYDNMGLEVELVDMHFGTDVDPAVDASLFEDHLHEIRHCHRVSRGCFFICLVGNKYLPCPLPERLDADTYDALYTTAMELELRADLLDTWFCRTDAAYVLRQPSDVTTSEWAVAAAELLEVIQGAARHLLAAERGGGGPSRFRPLTQSAVERQFSHALGLAPGTAHRILAVVRDWEKLPSEGQTQFQDSASVREQLKNFRDRLAASLPNENRIYLAVPWKPGGSGLDPDCEEHEAYLTKFREMITAKLKCLISRSLEDEPEVKARNKTVQEVFQEALSHLTLVQSPTDVEDALTMDAVDAVRALVTSAYAGSARHPPIIVRGAAGAGKSGLLGAVHRHCADWFGGANRVLRVYRACGATPRAAYNLELLRVICQQLRLLLSPAGSADGALLPKDASFDPLYVNNWFQTLLRRFEETASGDVLVLLLDDLHRLNPLDSDIVAALSWLPVSLPRNVHVVATTALPPEQLKLTPLQRERFRAADSYMELPTATETTDLERQVEESLEALEERFGKTAISRLAGFLTASEFGLSETELLELLMPTTNSQATLSLTAGHFNFSSLCAVRRSMGPVLLCEKLMSGKLLLCWKHDLTKEVSRRRYLHSQDTLRATHAEVANLFFSEFSQQNSEADTEEAAQSPTENKETPFQTMLPADDVTYSLRHVEESWIHLLKAGDSCRLKQLTVCNFDFLLAAVQTISVSYLRCVLEHVRCYLLDRDLELVYYTVRKSSDVLTRDPLQLGAQVVCWLRPVADDSGDLVSHMITAAMAWCDGYTAPLLVPLNGWLQPPLPLQIKSLHCSVGVKLIEPTPSGQHVVVVPQNGDPQLWHVMSNTLTHTFKGHSGPVLCLAITKQSQYLLTGSEDISIIVWDLKTLTLKLRIYEHIAPVLSLTPALSNAVIVSGGEDSRIIITSLLTGDVVMKIDHHRGPVTAVKVTAAGDVLVSGSSDATVCLWSLENFNLLNSISLPSPILMLDVSLDSVFLVAACEDNQLYLRSLATGTEIHCLKGHKSEIRSVCLAQDNCRAIVGGSDGKIYIFDMHSGRLSRTLTSHSSEVSGVKVTEKDDFLLTAGGNRITFWSFRKDDATGPSNNISRKTSQQSQQMHTSSITCIDISRDGTMAVTGAVDSLVNIWQLNTHELHSTLEGHIASITCVAFSPNGLFAVSGSEDKTARVWGLTLGLVVSTFKGHQATVTAVAVMMDSRRVVSSDRQGMLAVWLADNATLLHTCGGPSKCLAITNTMKYAVCGNGDNSLRIWSVNREDERYTVSHSEEITCFVLTTDSQYVITGSRDMSLKVWQVAGGKLAQVLVGHTDHVTCVAVPILNKPLVVSGSRDSNLIVWDINTGNDIHVLSGHLGYVTTVKVTGDGSLAVSGSEDKSIIVWDTKRGRVLSCLQLQVPILNLEMSPDASRIAVHLLENRQLPIVCLHNTPATYVKMPSYVAPAKDIEDLRPSGPKRPMRRLLKKEVSLDTYTWQKKYGHLTSSIMMAAVDERLKRRFSVSASMEEISKIPTKGSMGSQQCVGPEQAALAQSQHFDQLEALWNKRSPPRRRHNQSLSKQNSRSSRRDSSDNEDRTPGEDIVDLPGDRVCV